MPHILFSSIGYDSRNDVARWRIKLPIIPYPYPFPCPILLPVPVPREEEKNSPRRHGGSLVDPGSFTTPRGRSEEGRKAGA
jgi:hypothetical protein